MGIGSVQAVAPPAVLLSFLVTSIVTQELASFLFYMRCTLSLSYQPNNYTRLKSTACDAQIKNPHPTTSRSRVQLAFFDRVINSRLIVRSDFVEFHRRDRRSTTDRSPTWRDRLQTTLEARFVISNSTRAEVGMNATPDVVGWTDATSISDLSRPACHSEMSSVRRIPLSFDTACLLGLPFYNSRAFHRPLCLWLIPVRYTNSWLTEQNNSLSRCTHDIVLQLGYILVYSTVACGSFGEVVNASELVAFCRR